MFSKILVPLDGSSLAEQVLPYVRQLGKHFHSNIRLIRAIEPVPPDLADPKHGLYLDRLAISLRNDARRYLNTTARPIRKSGLSVVSRVHESDAAACIVREAEQDPGTLVAMATHGRTGLGRWMLGSVMDKVLHAVPNPLLAVRAKDERDFSRDAAIEQVVVPLDGSSIAEQALPLASSIAQALSIKIVLLRATPTTLAYYQGRDYFNTSVEEVLEEEARAAVKYLHDTALKFNEEGVSQMDELVVHGSPASTIINAVHDLPNCLIAMTTHGRSGVERWVLGSVADRVIRGSECPVLLIRAT